MKIGIISAMKGAPWGGSEELWANAAEAALLAGMSVSICLQRPITGQPKLEKLRQAGAYIVGELPENSIANDIAARSEAISYRLGQSVRRRLSPTKSFFSQDYDVLLFNDGGAVPSTENIAMLRGRYPLTPYVTLSHNMPHFSFLPDVRLQAAAFFDSAFAALFVSKRSLAETEKVLCHKICNSRVVRNPVNMSVTEPIEWVDSTVAKMALVGELDVSRKGQDLLFEALSHEQWRDRAWRLSVYGTGADESYLRDLSMLYGLDSKIAFRGYTSNIRAIWSDNQILLQPSRVESAPLSIVEAMLCGRSIVTTAVGGIQEWVADGESGFVAKAATVELILDALERAWRSRSLWRKFGSRARAAAEELYDPAPAETLLSILTAAARRQPRITRPIKMDFSVALSES